MYFKFLTFDAHNAVHLATFWADLLDWDLAEAHSPSARRAIGPTGTSMLFIPVPEGKTSKNRCHPDLHTDDLDGSVAKAEALGATVIARVAGHSRFVVFHDPEGNEFCIVEDAPA